MLVERSRPPGGEGARERVDSVGSYSRSSRLSSAKSALESIEGRCLKSVISASAGSSELQNSESGYELTARIRLLRELPQRRY